MDALEPSSATTKRKLARVFHKASHLKTATKTLSNNGFCLMIPHEHKLGRDRRHEESRLFDGDDMDEATARSRAAMEAFVTKLFASVSAIKAAYAEFQMAQYPYNPDAIHSADEAVVQELKAISELKQSFLKKEIDSAPPQVTMLLAEIREHQSLKRMYEITMKRLQSDSENKGNEIFSLHKELSEIISNNKFLERKLNSSGQFSVLDFVKFPNSNLNDFSKALHYGVRSVRSFVKQMVREMESVNWDIDVAARSIESGVVFRKANHRCFAFESFVSGEMFDGFNSPSFSLLNESPKQWREICCNQLRTLKACNAIDFLKQNPTALFGKFTSTKYLGLVHQKMETSFSGNLSQRKLISSGEYPETTFFAAFAEMARRVWLLHCLAFAFDQEVSAFQVKRGSRFTEVYMEGVTDDVFEAADDGPNGGLRVAYTVVPGFIVGKTVIQSQVYLSPVGSPAN